MARDQRGNRAPNRLPAGTFCEITFARAATTAVAFASLIDEECNLSLGIIELHDSPNSANCDGQGCIISLIEVALPAGTRVPQDAIALIAEADRRIEQLWDQHVIPAFVPSDFELVYLALQGIADHGLATGERFCEWGSGIGANVCLAAMLGFEAAGIEIEPLLVAAARELAHDFDLSAEFIQGSFVPADSHACLDAGETFAWLSFQSGQCPEHAGFGPADVDVFFCYPWTDEESLIPALFDRHAGVGALLLTYRGGDDLLLRRKVSSTRRKKMRSRR
ncbi:MAG: hypothetical protein ACJ8C4_08775 [Gemmataceae bacterium]